MEINLEEVKKLYQELKSVHKVGVYFGISGTCIYNLLKKNNISIRKVDYILEDVKKYIEIEGYTLLSGYTGIKNPITLKCPKGHIYTTTFNDFKNGGTRCLECSGEWPFERIKKYIEDKGYKVLDTCWKEKSIRNKARYINTICPNGHSYKLNFVTFKAGKAHCPECSKNVYIQKFEEIVRKNNYQIIKEVETLEFTRFVLKCPEGHEYETYRHNFLQNHRCPVCVKHVSGIELSLREFISSLKIPFDTNNRKIIEPYELDIYIPEKKLGIEMHGLFWHSYESSLKFNKISSKQAKYQHKIKADLAEKVGIKLLQIFEDEWLYKREIVENLIKQTLGVSEKVKVNARDCLIKEVNFKDTEKFLNKYHIGGAGLVGVIRLGLYYKEELVSVLTFEKGSLSKNIKDKEGVFELYKFCSKENVRGALGKLFSYFKEKYAPIEVRTYVDRRFFDGHAFIGQGFKLEKKTEPNYFYFKLDTIKRYHRFGLRKTWKEKITEAEVRFQQGYFKIFDAGHLKLIYKE